MTEGERKYEIRYCAFLDILGFTDLISNIGKGDIDFDVVRALLRTIHEPSKYGDAGTADFRATTISDAIALSSSFSESGLEVLVDTITRLVLGALEEGYFMRGGLCRGQLYHDNEMVFGEAFIKAFHIESKIARYPRIMVAKEVYDHGVASNLTSYFRTHLTQADDGPYFVHVLEEINMGLAIINAGVASEAIAKARLASFVKMKNQIERRVAETADNPSHFEKVQWFAKYWNASFAPTETRTGRVKGPGLDVVTWRSGSEP